jgi:glycosyltransferase involved in cell wall biosynthesis
VTAPMVSVITPTWRRNKLLMSRCIPSVQAQDYGRVQHVVFSDGPDEQLMRLLRAFEWKHPLVYAEFPERDPLAEFGSRPRKAALAQAAGEYITYCDDDDALRPEHCRLMAEALDADPEAGFAVSRMVSHHAHPVIVGWGPLACGNVGSPMLMHRRSILEHGTWGPDSWTEDWDLIERWLEAGVKYVNVDAETSDVWPSVYR